MTAGILAMPDYTHEVAARSWVVSANDPMCDFPIQNLPYAIFRRRNSGEAFRAGIAIGDQILDLAAVSGAGLLDGAAASAARACAAPSLNAFMAMGEAPWRALRHAVFALLQANASGAPATRTAAVSACFVPQQAAEYDLPAVIGDYTDFFTSFHHSANIGRVNRPNDTDLVRPTFRWIPLAYHGRVSSIALSGQPFHRPAGQAMPAGQATPVFGPCRKLDYEMELGFFVGPGNAPGHRLSVDEASHSLFGACLLIDWSARDLQAWEGQPLGPFLSKNFASTVSPWVVTMDALLPYRQPWTRDVADRQPLPYLESPLNRASGGLDIRIEAVLETPGKACDEMCVTPLGSTSFSHQYWSIAQMVAHHTASGCNLRPGDLIGSGTISGPGPTEAGSLIELARNGTQPMTLRNGEVRAFLHDGDSVRVQAHCSAPQRARIGFGQCFATVLASLEEVPGFAPREPAARSFLID